MFRIEKLETPESHSDRGMPIVLTHICRALHVDPRKGDKTVEIWEWKGFLFEDIFQDWGPVTVTTLDAKGYADLLAISGDGHFDSAYILSIIEKRKSEIEEVRQAEIEKQRTIEAASLQALKEKQSGIRSIKLEGAH